MNTIKAKEKTYWILDDKHGILEKGQELASKTKPFSTTNKNEWLKKLGVSSEKELEDNEASELEDYKIQSLKDRLIDKVKSVVSKRLSATDYMVIRHLGQKALTDKGKLAKTKLSDTEYDNLELVREALRDWSNEKEAEINSKTKIEELKKIKVEY